MVLNIDSSIEDIKNWVTEEDILKVISAMEYITKEDLTKEDIDSINKAHSNSNKK